MPATPHILEHNSLLAGGFEFFQESPLVGARYGFRHNDVAASLAEVRRQLFQTIPIRQPAKVAFSVFKQVKSIESFPNTFPVDHEVACYGR